MIKDKVFYAAIEKASNTLMDKRSHRKFLCSTISELESCIDAYLEANMNLMRASLIVGISSDMVRNRIKLLVQMGLKIPKPERNEPSHLDAEEKAKLHYEGLSYERERESLKKSCAEHLADLHRYHGRAARNKAA